MELRTGDHVALVGPNGAGKSTLLRILTGELQADSGDIETPTRGSIGYLQQHPDFSPEATVWSTAAAAIGDVTKLAAEAERIAEELAATHEEPLHSELMEELDRMQTKLQQQDAYNWEHRVERVLAGMGFTQSWYQHPAQQLSGGQQNRLMLVCLLLQQPDLMILDEPNNHLDIESTEWLEATLADWPGAFLIVSHDRFFLDRTSTSVLELVNGKLDRFKGNYSAYVRQKSERLEVQRRTFARKQEEIEKLEDFIRKHHHGQKSTQAEDRRKKLARIELVEPPREIHTPKFHFPKAARTGDVVLRAKDLSKAYDEPLFSELTFQIERGERWAILGSNGSGKSTLLKCLLGEVEPDQGEVTLGHKLKVGYFDQLLKQLPPDTEAVEAIRVPGRDLDNKDRRDILARFGLAGDVVDKPVRMLSGGEKNRVMLAWLSAMEANFLVLDEPTNHLDLWSRQALEAAIGRFDGTVLLVTHDRYLVNAVADHVLVMQQGRVSQVDGNYDAYLHWLKQGLAVADRGSFGQSTAPQAQLKSAGSRQPAKGERRKRKFPYRKVEELESEIADKESSMERLHEEMMAPENLRDGRKMKQLQQSLAELEQDLLRLYEHYEEACELN